MTLHCCLHMMTRTGVTRDKYLIRVPGRPVTVADDVARALAEPVAVPSESGMAVPEPLAVCRLRLSPPRWYGASVDSNHVSGLSTVRPLSGCRSGARRLPVGAASAPPARLSRRAAGGVKFRLIMDPWHCDPPPPGRARAAGRARGRVAVSLA